MLTLSFEIENEDLPKISELLSRNGINKFEVEDNTDTNEKQYQQLLKNRLAVHEAEPETGYSLQEASERLKNKYGF